MAHSEYMVRYLIAFVWIGIVGGNLCYAQQDRDSMLAERQRVADALTYAANHGQGRVVLNPPVRVLNALQICDTVDTLPVELIFSGNGLAPGQFRLRQRTRDPYNMVLAGVHHPLVDRLNFYLNHIWAIDICAIPGIDCNTILPAACSGSGNDSLVAAVQEDSLGLSALEQQIIRDYIDSVSERSDLLNSSYTINGSSVDGEDIVSFWQPTSFDPSVDAAFSYRIVRGNSVKVLAFPPWFKVEYDGSGMKFILDNLVSMLNIDSCAFQNAFLHGVGDTSKHGSIEFSANLSRPLLPDSCKRTSIREFLQFDDYWQYLTHSSILTDLMGKFEIDADGYLIYRAATSGHTSNLLGAFQNVATAWVSR